MQFVDWTPRFISRIFADGILGVIYILPRTVALVIFAGGCFLLVDALMAGIDSLFGRAALRSALRTPVGSRRSRARLLLGRAPGWLARLLVGLPMFYVLQLVLAGDEAAKATLSALASGFAWEAAALEKIPFRGASALGGVPASVLQVLLIISFALFVYLYNQRAFAVVRRVRATGDALLQLAMSVDHDTPADSQSTLGRFRNLGFAEESIQSVAWFLMLINARILKRNEAFSRLPPTTYGLWMALRDVMVAAVFTVIHPIVAGLFVASEMKKARELTSLTRAFRLHFSRLPNRLQDDLQQKQFSIEGGVV